MSPAWIGDLMFGRKRKEKEEAPVAVAQPGPSPLTITEDLLDPWRHPQVFGYVFEFYDDPFNKLTVWRSGAFPSLKRIANATKIEVIFSDGTTALVKDRSAASSDPGPGVSDEDFEKYRRKVLKKLT